MDFEDVAYAFCLTFIVVAAVVIIFYFAHLAANRYQVHDGYYGTEHVYVLTTRDGNTHILKEVPANEETSGL